MLYDCQVTEPLFGGGILWQNMSPHCLAIQQGNYGQFTWLVAEHAINCGTLQFCTENTTTTTTQSPEPTRTYSLRIPTDLYDTYYANLSPQPTVAGTVMSQGVQYSYAWVCSVVTPPEVLSGYGWQQGTPVCLSIPYGEYYTTDWMYDQQDTFCQVDNSPCSPPTVTTTTTQAPPMLTWAVRIPASLYNLHYAGQGGGYPGGIAGRIMRPAIGQQTMVEWYYLWQCSVTQPLFGYSGYYWTSFTPYCLASSNNEINQVNWDVSELDTLCGIQQGLCSGVTPTTTTAGPTTTTTTTTTTTMPTTTTTVSYTHLTLPTI